MTNMFMIQSVIVNNYAYTNVQSKRNALRFMLLDHREDF